MQNINYLSIDLKELDKGEHLKPGKNVRKEIKRRAEVHIQKAKSTNPKCISLKITTLMKKNGEKTKLTHIRNRGREEGAGKMGEGKWEVRASSHRMNVSHGDPVHSRGWAMVSS